MYTWKYYKNKKENEGKQEIIKYTVLMIIYFYMLIILTS